MVIHMEIFLGHPPSDLSYPWKEWQLQAYVIMQSRRLGHLVAGDMNAGKRNPGQAKASGILSGECDLRYYFPLAKTIFIELKRAKGRLDQLQIEHHDLLRWMGFEVFVVFAATPADCWRQVLALLPEPPLAP